MDRKFIIKKDETDNSVTYMEYEKREGLKMKPKHKVSFEDMINVNEIVIINHSLIEKLISKKCNKNLKRIIDMTMLVPDEDDDGDGYNAILDEISRLQGLLVNKYEKYMNEKEYETMLKKLEMIKDEVLSRKINALNLEYEKRKSSR